MKTIEQNSYLWEDGRGGEGREGFWIQNTTSASQENNTSGCHFPSVSDEPRMCVCVL